MGGKIKKYSNIDAVMCYELQSTCLVVKLEGNC